MYCPLITKMPAESGVSTTVHVPDSPRVQLESTLGPSEYGPLRRTNAVGVEEKNMVSSTVTVQVVDEPTETADGEQAIVVEVGSWTESSTLPELVQWVESPR